MSDKLEDLCLKVRASTNDKWFDKAKAELQSYIDTKVIEELESLEGWIYRNHITGTAENDRWYLASQEITSHIQETIAELKLKGRSDG